VLLHVCLLENNRLAAHRLPAHQAGNATSCTLQRGASIRARRRELLVTNIEIESSRRQTTGEAIVEAAGSPSAPASIALSASIYRLLTAAEQVAEFILVLAAVQVSDLASAGLTLVSVVTHPGETALHSRPCSVG
jgi:hypothetical protein